LAAPHRLWPSSLASPTSPPDPAFFFVTRRPPRSPLFPYTTLFRSSPRWLDRARRREAAGRHSAPLRRRHSRILAHSASIRECRRSEEHTSELQSLTNLVCRLLLEKKKKATISHTHRAKVAAARA